MATFGDLPRLFAPGTRWPYSSSGSHLLGLVIEKIAGAAVGGSAPRRKASSPKGHRMLSYSGHVPGYTAQPARYPDDDLTIVVLTNTDSVAPLRIESQIADLLLVRR